MDTIRLTGPDIFAIEPLWQDRIVTTDGHTVWVIESDTGAEYPLDDAPGRDVIAAHIQYAYEVAAERFDRGRAARAAMGEGPWPLENVDAEDLAGAAWIASEGHRPPALAVVDPACAVSRAARWGRVADSTRACADEEIAARERGA